MTFEEFFAAMQGPVVTYQMARRDHRPGAQTRQDNARMRIDDLVEQRARSLRREDKRSRPDGTIQT